MYSAAAAVLLLAAGCLAAPQVSLYTHLKKAIIHTLTLTENFQNNK